MRLAMAIAQLRCSASLASRSARRLATGTGVMDCVLPRGVVQRPRFCRLAMTLACEQPAKHFTSTLPAGVSLIDNDGVVSSWAGQHAIQLVPLGQPLRPFAIASALKR